MLTQEEIKTLKNRRVKTIEKKLQQVPINHWFNPELDHYHEIRDKNDGNKLSLRRFLAKYDPPRAKDPEKTRIDGVYRIAEYLKYVEFVARPDVEKMEIFGFKTDADFCRHYQVDQHTLYIWKRKDAFKKRVIDFVQKESVSKAANVAKFWYDKISSNPQKCSAADFEKFLMMCGITSNKSEKTVNNNFTAIRWKSENEENARVVDGEVVSSEEPENNYLDYEG